MVESIETFIEEFLEKKSWIIGGFSRSFPGAICGRISPGLKKNTKKLIGLSVEEMTEKFFGKIHGEIFGDKSERISVWNPAGISGKKSAGFCGWIPEEATSHISARIVNEISRAVTE